MQTALHNVCYEVCTKLKFKYPRMCLPANMDYLAASRFRAPKSMNAVIVAPAAFSFL